MKVASAPLSEAVTTTFLAPPSRCPAAPSRFVKMPVDSITMSAPTSPQGTLAGSLSQKALISRSPIRKMLSSTLTFSGHIPWMESRLKNTKLCLGLVSLIAMISTSLFSIAALATSIPIRPKPFIPTRAPTVSPLGLVQRLIFHPNTNRWPEPPRLGTVPSLALVGAACAAYYRRDQEAGKLGSPHDCYRSQ